MPYKNIYFYRLYQDQKILQSGLGSRLRVEDTGALSGGAEAIFFLNVQAWLVYVKKCWLKQRFVRQQVELFASSE